MCCSQRLKTADRQPGPARIRAHGGPGPGLKLLLLLPRTTAGRSPECNHPGEQLSQISGTAAGAPLSSYRQPVKEESQGATGAGQGAEVNLSASTPAAAERLTGAAAGLAGSPAPPDPAAWAAALPLGRSPEYNHPGEQLSSDLRNCRRGSSFLLPAAGKGREPGRNRRRPGRGG